MLAQPQKEHEWLHRLMGEWTYEQECHSEPGQPAELVNGTETVRSLGGMWVVLESIGKMADGTEAHMMMTLGYDPAKKRYLGTWVGSMMTHMWIYDGELDETGNILTLHCEGPSFTEEGKMAQYKDVIEFKSDDLRTLSSHALGDDGKWTEFMSVPYHRKA